MYGFEKHQTEENTLLEAHHPNAAGPRVPVLMAGIDAIDMNTAVEQIVHWAQARESRFVCLSNAHSVVTASHDPAFAQALDAADLVAPDGAPVAWMLRRLGHAGQRRVSGPDLMLASLAAFAESGTPIFLYGSTPQTLEALNARLRNRWPALRIVGQHSPPFRALSHQEDEADMERIKTSGAGVVWVSLGCPKQELWMAAHKGRVQAVMVGVGAAFDFHAGVVRRAPRWMRALGLEWLHRLSSEPRRLWRRYLVTNSLFMVGALRQLAARRRH